MENMLQASFSPIFTPKYADKPRQCPPPAPASASALEGKIQFIIEIKNPTWEQFRSSGQDLAEEEVSESSSAKKNIFAGLR